MDSGGLTITTAQSKFGGAGGNFIGNYFVSTAYSNDWIMDGDFTIDFWVKLTVVTADTYTFVGNTNYGWKFEYLVSGSGAKSIKFFFRGTPSNVTLNYSNTLNANTWYHLAVERYGDLWTIFVNGTKIGQQTQAFTYSQEPPYPLQVGRFFDGYLDEVRISKGIARYHGNNFTPPTAAY